MLDNILEVLDSKAGMSLNLDSRVIRISLAKEIEKRIEEGQIKNNVHAPPISRRTAKAD